MISLKTSYDIFHSPIGPLYIAADETGIKTVALTPERWDEYQKKHGFLPRDGELCRPAIRQLEEYFAGKRRGFTVPLSVEGAEFSKKVWLELVAIPYGETRSYSDIAKAVGNPKSCRAVGQANRNNPLPIFVPCHRVIGKNGALTGYMGKQGLTIKEYLLELEWTHKNTL